MEDCGTQPREIIYRNPLWGEATFLFHARDEGEKSKKVESYRLAARETRDRDRLRQTDRQTDVRTFVPGAYVSYVSYEVTGTYVGFVLVLVRVGRRDARFF